jgi:lipooligosaccharide transport system permease protein
VLITTRLFPTRPLGRSRAHKVLERDILVYRRNWTIIISGFFEPIFYLLGIGYGLGTLVGDVGDIPYAAYVAPGLMATAAMNGALFESTFNLFFKLKYAKTFDAILSTPLGPSDIAIGEVSWALTRGLMYAIAFLVVMLLLGLVLSPWGILMIPGALLIGLAAASIGMAATTFMRKWQDFDLVTVVMMPLFLFSGTFFPISVYPAWLETIVALTPLYRGVHMLRSFSTGEVGPMVLVDIAYLAILGLIGVTITAHRLRGLLLK